jgi:hypothetical protein
MKTLSKAAAVSAAVLLSGLSLSPVTGQDTKRRTVEQFQCKDVMRESGTDRDVAIAFLHGFLLGKSGSSNFDIDELRKQTNNFIERCLANPDEKAVDVMSKIKS